MASLTEHVMINKLGDDLDEAITFAGGDTTDVTNIMQYPQIIKEQLSACCGSMMIKEMVLEGDSAIIIADEAGRDEYNTLYASGIKTGLNPDSYYIRICTAVKDIEPVYIDLTPVTDLIQTSGGVVNIDAIVKKVIESPEIKDAINKEVQSTIENITTDIENITSNITTINQTLETKVDQADIEQIVIDKLESNTNNDGINVDELDW